MSLYFNGNGAFKQEHLDQLSEWIQESPQNAERFAHVAYLHRAIHDSLAGREIQRNILSDTQNEDILDETTWKTFAEYEKTAPEIKLSKEESHCELIQKVVYPQREKRKFSKFNWSSAFKNLFIIDC